MVFQFLQALRMLFTMTVFGESEVLTTLGDWYHSEDLSNFITEISICYLWISVSPSLASDSRPSEDCNYVIIRGIFWDRLLF